LSRRFANLGYLGDGSMTKDNSAIARCVWSPPAKPLSSDIAAFAAFAYAIIAIIQAT
jgi:hypothetical protein